VRKGEKEKGRDRRERVRKGEKKKEREIGEREKERGF
jgi:hypothetical protein